MSPQERARAKRKAAEQPSKLVPRPDYTQPSQRDLIATRKEKVSSRQAKTPAEYRADVVE